MNSFQQINPYPNGVNQGFTTSAPQPAIHGSNPFFNMYGNQLPNNQFPFQVLNLFDVIFIRYARLLKSSLFFFLIESSSAFD